MSEIAAHCGLMLPLLASAVAAEAAAGNAYEFGRLAELMDRTGRGQGPAVRPSFQADLASATAPLARQFTAGFLGDRPIELDRTPADGR